jgi:CheY-like chemotaxis protein
MRLSRVRYGGTDIGVLFLDRPKVQDAAGVFRSSFLGSQALTICPHWRRTCWLKPIRLARYRALAQPEENHLTMEKFSQKSGLPGLPGQARAGARFRAMPQACQLVLAAFLFCCVGLVRAEDEQPEEDVSALEKELVRHNAAPLPAAHHNYVLPAVALLLAGMFASRKLGSKITALKARLAPSVPVPSGAADILAEDQSFSEFAASFRAAPDASPAGRGSGFSFPGQTRKNAADTADASLKEFFASAVKDLTIARNYLSAISRASDEAGRQKLLVDLSRQIGSLKRKSGLPAVLLVRQMAFAMEGLLNQLAERPSSVTPSSLRTLTGAVNLLDALCVPGLNQGLASDPPVRLLAVDDDPIGRRAISVTLEKAFAKPDVAEDGETALALATEHSYDAIFLDVQMPGMDGFATCSRIHDTDANRATPVVFVTCHGDFEARAKSTRVGGHDLIAKPFLTFEITLKALTLVLDTRRRWAATEEASGLTAGNESPGSSKGLATASMRPAQVAGVNANGVGSAGEVSSPDAPARPLSVPLDPFSAGSPDPIQEQSSAGPDASPGDETSLANCPEQSPDDFAEAFYAHAPAQLEAMRAELQGLSGATDEEERKDILGGLYIQIHSLSSEAEQAELRSAFRLSAALQALLKKLLEQPALSIASTASTADTAAAALDLLDDLCRSRLNPDLANPPLQILVVDDDPVARRAISGALQLALEKPDSAESGEAALTLAAERPFDMIFLDILMPGMDGFTTCSKIHETAANIKTPVVFVTSHSDMESRDRATLSGGSGFIPKPVLPAEIRVTALTFCLRGRLDQLNTPGILEAAAGS